ncbi:MAG: 50S ribosomal protein L23 [Parcubacteria group bacterium]|nr:50S ribosomal protein L23 [Parcubacteria group bacterium]
MSLFGSKKKEKEVKPQTIGQTTSGSINRVSGHIIKPVVSEKALAMENTGEYVFQVGQNATKPEVKKEIEGKYKVKVVRVNISVAKPKSRVFKGKKGYRSGFKKAMVKLAAGQRIEVSSKSK